MQTKMGVAQKSSVTTGRSKVIDYTIPLNANMAPTDSCDQASKAFTLEEFEYQKGKKLYADMFMNKKNGGQDTPVKRRDDGKPAKIPNALKIFMK